MVNNNNGRAKYRSSISNNKQMGPFAGLAPSVGVDASTRFSMKFRGTQHLLSLAEYNANLKRYEGRNPQTSGGVGKKVLMHFRS